jgi:hypothetical protein
MYGDRIDPVRHGARRASAGQRDLRKDWYRSEMVALSRMRERWNPYRCGAASGSRSIPESDGHRVPVLEKPTTNHRISWSRAGCDIGKGTLSGIHLGAYSCS